MGKGQVRSAVLDTHDSVETSQEFPEQNSSEHWGSCLERNALTNAQFDRSEARDPFAVSHHSGTERQA